VLGRRDEVVLRLLLDTGVRVSELCGLELTDVDLDRELAHVTATPGRSSGLRSGGLVGAEDGPVPVFPTTGVHGEAAVTAALNGVPIG
jgi:integrase